MQLHADTLFVHDDQGRLLFVNEPMHPERHPAPLVFVGRTLEGSICRCRHDLPAGLSDELEQLARQQDGSPLAANPLLTDKIRQRLEEAGWHIGRVSEGPAYFFPEILLEHPPCVRVDRSNAGLLREHFEDIVLELDAVQPCVAIVVERSAVSNCRTVRRSAWGAEAGVNTAPGYRQRGLGTAVVARWALLVREVGHVPLYSTSCHNLASRGLAAKLGLVQYGTDLELFEEISEL